MKSLPNKSTFGLFALATIVLANSLYPQPVHATDAVPRLLPETLETALALSAAPRTLREGAGVYLLRRGGYQRTKPARNHFDCFVVRTVARFDVQSADTLIPICLDDEGMRAIAPIHFDTARLRESGQTPNQIRAHLKAGFGDGTYQATQRTGLSYMISPVLNLPDGEGGIWNYPPHFMVYAPHLTNAQQNTRPDRGGGWLPWINNEGPHGMIIIPVGAAEQAIIRREEADLIGAVEAFLAEK